MKINVPSLLAGICIAISGSLFASSVSVPFVFNSGEKAKASEVNANFSTLSDAINQLAGKLSNVESNLSSVSDFVGATNKETIPISQIDLPVGSKITVHGVQYTIVQFEFPRFDADETYLIKYPTSQSLANTYFNENINVGGKFPEESFNGYDQLKAGIISGFPVTASEDFGFNNRIYIYDKNRSTTANFSQSLRATICVGSKTYLGISFSYSRESNANSKIISADTTDISHAYPITMTQTDREQLRTDLRTLLNYIVIQKK